MSKEISNLQIAVNDPPRPYIAILGGTKCDDSLKVAKNLIDKEIIDTIPVVGVVGNMMLWASGVDIGEGNKSFIRNALGDDFQDTWALAELLYENHKEFFLLPSDVAVEVDGNRVAMNVSELPTKYPIYDIGISTLQEIRPLMINAGCVLWNGPASYFELPGFAFGTIEILNMCTESSAVTIVGGGHTSSLVSNRGVTNLVTHNSTGGGACLTMLSGGSMPVIESLNKSNDKFRPLLPSLELEN
jgi:phosphoglycerate kinase